MYICPTDTRQNAAWGKETVLGCRAVYSTTMFLHAADSSMSWRQMASEEALCGSQSLVKFPTHDKRFQGGLRCLGKRRVKRLERDRLSRGFKVGPEMSLDMGVTAEKVAMCIHM